ncbi:MAG: class I SAM-dependent methyltransferase [Pseudomonadota bacterium]
MNQDASKFVGSIPTHYDQGLGPVMFEGMAAEVAERVAHFKPQAVLELAAGTGILTRELRNKLAPGSDLVATDLNEPMLDIAREKFSDQEHVTFEQGDAMALRYKDEQFDLAVCQFGIMFFPDKVKSHQQVHRVLRSGGDYLFTVWGSIKENDFAHVAQETVMRFFPNDPPEFYQVPFGYHNADEIRDAAQRGGFDEVEVDKLTVTTPIHSVPDFARGLIFGNPLGEEIKKIGGDPEEVCGSLEEAIRNELGGSITLRAYLAHAGRWH